MHRNLTALSRTLAESRLLTLASLAGVSLLAACSPSADASTSGTPSAIDAGTAGTLDATSADGQDGGVTVEAAVRRFHDARARLQAVFCQCELPGYLTRDQCESFNESPVSVNCDYSLRPDRGDVWDCVAGATERLVGCIASEFEESGECSETCFGPFVVDTKACGVEALEGEAALADYEACIQRDLVGDPGGCTDPSVPVSSAVGPGVFRGNTLLAGSDIGTACGLARRSPDRGFWWAAPHAGRFAFDTAGSAYEAFVYLNDGCVDVGEARCGTEMGPPWARAYSVSDVFAEGEMRLVVVDSEISRAGDFVVNVTELP